MVKENTGKRGIRGQERREGERNSGGGGIGKKTDGGCRRRDWGA